LDKSTIKKLKARLNKTLLITGCLVFFFIQTSLGQLSGSFYSGGGDAKIGIGYDFSDKVWADLRMYGGVTFNDFTPEITGNYNFVRKEKHDVYTGLGFSVNGRNGFFIPLGFRVRPFEKLNDFSLVVEAEPMYNFDIEDLVFVCFGGIRYTFKTSEK